MSSLRRTQALFETCSCFSGAKRATKFFAPGGQRNPLKRLISDKEIQGNPSQGGRRLASRQFFSCFPVNRPRLLKSSRRGRRRSAAVANVRTVNLSFSSAHFRKLNDDGLFYGYTVSLRIAAPPTLGAVMTLRKTAGRVCSRSASSGGRRVRQSRS
jgi:hypothetical protein